MGCIVKRIYCRRDRLWDIYRRDVKPLEPKQNESKNICDFFEDVISVKVSDRPNSDVQHNAKRRPKPPSLLILFCNYAAFLLFAIPIRPRRPEPKSHTAAGSGTELTTILSIPADWPPTVVKSTLVRFIQPRTSVLKAPASTTFATFVPPPLIWPVDIERR